VGDSTPGGGHPTDGPACGCVASVDASIRTGTKSLKALVRSPHRPFAALAACCANSKSVTPDHSAGWGRVQPIEILSISEAAIALSGLVDATGIDIDARTLSRLRSILPQPSRRGPKSSSREKGR
jgi:hypothetical protein